jgi:hypothetical protein
MSKINAELKKLKGKEDLTKKELSLLRKLNLAKTAKKNKQKIMKKIFNFQQFVNENKLTNEWYRSAGHRPEGETIDAEHEELEFCPQCGEDWEYCVCGEQHNMTHIPSDEMELVAHEDYTFLDEEDDDTEETNEKKKMNAGFAAFLAKKKAGKKAEDKDEKGSKKGGKPDFLDLDKDGDKKEPMKKAAKEAKTKKK